MRDIESLSVMAENEGYRIEEGKKIAANMCSILSILPATKRNGLVNICYAKGNGFFTCYVKGLNSNGKAGS